jgi:hypothetical protein
MRSTRKLCNEAVFVLKNFRGDAYDGSKESAKNVGRGNFKIQSGGRIKRVSKKN